MVTKQGVGNRQQNSQGFNTAVKGKTMKRKKQQVKYIDIDNDGGHSRYRLPFQQVRLKPDYILKKVFRKDGPPLGVEFDSLPSHAFQYCRKGSRKSHRACQEKQRALKRKKVCEPTILNYQLCDDESVLVKKHGIGKGLMSSPPKKHGIGKGLMSAPVKKHGIGKGLMTVWRATNPDAGDSPAVVDFGDRALFQLRTAISTKPTVQEKKKRVRRLQPVTQRLVNKSRDKRKPSTKSRKVECQKIERRKQPCKEKCELALEGVRCQEELGQFAMLVDDEELELRELQAGPNPLTCSAHFATNGLHGCSLCKDLLAKFPPNSVTMKQPLCMQPWDSSPELAKKLFKIGFYRFS
ncbi:unnamed protein product [Ilex paraguariensis]|uniref:Uncharacterized protein n=1 Tax=Ilex paraguariensis TaxID=185542 RepID=A0ABC8V2Y2_9AQUA